MGPGPYVLLIYGVPMRQPARRRPARQELADLAAWLLLTAAALVLTAFAMHLPGRLGSAVAPFVGSSRDKLDAGTVLAPAVAVVVLLAVQRGWVQRISWRWLLVSSYAAAAAWTLGLAAVERGSESHLSVASREHPPGPGVLLRLVDRWGLHGPVALGLAVALVGATTVPLVLSCVRSLCHEPAARAVLPLLVLGPWARWGALSVDVVVATLSAAMISCSVRASSPDRRGVGAVSWATACGLLLGVAALFSYTVPWLALSVIGIYFVRRRAALNVVTGIAALAPIALAQARGFVWTRGLAVAQEEFSLGVEPHRPVIVWAASSVLVLLLAGGPALVASARKIRRTPGWPFLVGAGASVVFAVGSGLSREDIAHEWLPYFPWLLVAAVAPERVGGAPVRAPVLLAGAGALSAVLLETVLQAPR